MESFLCEHYFINTLCYILSSTIRNPTALETKAELVFLNICEQCLSLGQLLTSQRVLPALSPQSAAQSHAAGWCQQWQIWFLTQFPVLLTRSGLQVRWGAYRQCCSITWESPGALINGEHGSLCASGEEPAQRLPGCVGDGEPSASRDSGHTWLGDSRAESSWLSLPCTSWMGLECLWGATAPVLLSGLHWGADMDVGCCRSVCLTLCAK